MAITWKSPPHRALPLETKAGGRDPALRLVLPPATLHCPARGWESSPLDIQTPSVLSSPLHRHLWGCVHAQVSQPDTARCAGQVLTSSVPVRLGHGRRGPEQEAGSSKDAKMSFCWC